MKKTTLLFAIASLALLTMASCEKEDSEKPASSETINTSLKINESYTFTLPATSKPEDFKIVTQGTHSSISQISKDASGNITYNYTPAAGYTGADMVVLSNEEEEGHHGKCGRHHEGNHRKKHHRHHDDDNEADGQKHIITINFTIANGTLTP